MIKPSGERELGWTMRPLEETLLDTAAALLEHHVVSEKTRR